MNLKDLLQLAGKEGKVVIVDEQGEVKGVFMAGSTYSTDSSTPNTKLDQQKRIEEAIERVNKAILEAQLEDDLETQPSLSLNSNSQPTKIDTVLSRRAQELFVSKPFGRSEAPQNDLRSEVVDPNFDQPAEHDDEEIAPNFDDI